MRGSIVDFGSHHSLDLFVEDSCGNLVSSSFWRVRSRYLLDSYKKISKLIVIASFLKEILLHVFCKAVCLQPPVLVVRASLKAPWERVEDKVIH